MKNNKILIICRDFIPYYPTFGGVIRVLTLAEFLLNHGREVYVLTSTGKDFGTFGYDYLLNKIHVDYVEDKWKENFQQRIKKATQGNLDNKKKTLVNRFKDKLKDFILDFIIPDTGIFVTKSYYKKAKKIIQTHDIKNIMVSSPPHSMQLPGSKLKKYFGDDLNLIIDYRDSWNTTSIFSKKYFVNQFISRRKEKKALARCDYFIYISQPIKDKAEKTFKLNLEAKSSLVMNGFHKEIQTKEREDHDKIHLGYFGVLSTKKDSIRDASKLFELFKDPEINSRIELMVYGQLDNDNDEIYEYPGLHFYRSVSHSEALRKMGQMDFLLIVHSDPDNSDEVITGKLFEYIAVKKPVVCLSPKNMEARRIIENNGIGMGIDIEKPDEIRDKLLKLPEYKGYDFYKNVDISRFKREEQYKKILSLLKC